MGFCAFIQNVIVDFPFRKYDFFQMACVDKKDTGLPYNILLDSTGSDRKKWQRIPNVKINVEGKIVHVSVGKNPRILCRMESFKDSDVILSWIQKNRKILLRHWNDKVTDMEALGLLSKNMCS